MKPRILIAAVLAITFAKVCLAEDWAWCTPLQVKQIALATQLATFPLPQGDLRSVIGGAKVPHLGGATDAQGRVYGIVALTDPDEAVGYYAARIVYGPNKEEDAAKIPILSVEVIFVSRAIGDFVSAPDDWMIQRLSALKKLMVEQKLTPIEFAESFHDGTAEAIRANQRPDGTSAKAPPSNPSQGAAVPHP